MDTRDFGLRQVWRRLERLIQTWNYTKMSGNTARAAVEIGSVLEGYLRIRDS